MIDYLSLSGSDIHQTCTSVQQSSTDSINHGTVKVISFSHLSTIRSHDHQAVFRRRRSRPTMVWYKPGCFFNKIKSWGGWDHSLERLEMTFKFPKVSFDSLQGFGSLTHHSLTPDHVQMSYQKEWMTALNISSLYTILGRVPIANEEAVEGAYKSQVKHIQHYLFFGHRSLNLNQLTFCWLWIDVVHSWMFPLTSVISGFDLWFESPLGQ